ncbi:MAG: hypothetical protein IT445_13650 [Phycisphaeraceae bacterium]|nr:hypothetical protein [Phycisphaeraceae bacterium]
MFNRLIDSYRPIHQPLMTRPSYSLELVTAMAMPLAMAMVEGRVVAVLARKVFDVGDFGFATIMAGPVLANITSMLWAMLARGRPKVGFITTLQSIMLLLIAAVAVLPNHQASRYGGTLLVAMMLTVRCLLAGLVTIRSTVWRHNYPRAVRGQITGRLAMVSSLIMSVAPLVTAPLLDYRVELFRVIYPLAAALAAVGVISFSRVRVRREKELLDFERQPAARPTPHGDAAPVYEFDNKATPESSTHFWNVLRRDRFYREYQLWQFVGGVANLMGDAAIAKLVIDWTERPPYRDYAFLLSMLLLVTLPMVVMMLVLPYWARYFDQVHIAQFRSRHSLYWILLQVLYWICAMLGPAGLLLVWLPQIVVGIINAGGTLAWNLGHNDFANRRLVAVYMGIHIMLTGVRGLFAAYLAIYLMEGWRGAGLLPGFAGIGPHVFLITVALSVVAEIGYQNLKRQLDSGRLSRNVAD